MADGTGERGNCEHLDDAEFYARVVGLVTASSSHSLAADDPWADLRYAHWREPSQSNAQSGGHRMSQRKKDIGEEDSGKPQKSSLNYASQERDSNHGDMDRASALAAPSGQIHRRRNSQETKYGISSTNRGYQLLKKAGWKEDTGLGAAEQGRREPVLSKVKLNKRGIGAEPSEQSKAEAEDYASRKEAKRRREDLDDETVGEIEEKKLSKKERKRQREVMLAKEQAIAKRLYRAFLPDNV